MLVENPRFRFEAIFAARRKEEKKKKKKKKKRFPKNQPSPFFPPLKQRVITRQDVSAQTGFREFATNQIGGTPRGAFARSGFTYARAQGKKTRQTWLRPSCPMRAPMPSSSSPPSSA
jgi:hypothetical protein